MVLLGCGIMAMNTPLYSKEVKQDKETQKLKDAPFSPGLKVEDKSALTALYSIMSTYQILNTNKLIEFGPEGELTELNFLYLSGKDFIIDGHVADDAVDMLKTEVRSEVLKNEVNSDICYVQDYIFSDGKRLVLGVHNEDNDDENHVFQCFTATLWFYIKDSSQGINVEDWRASLAKLIVESPRK